jgi:antibiotic biosynthesis monooxygenase (ABM) superfamily enzyme
MSERWEMAAVVQVVMLPVIVGLAWLVSDVVSFWSAFWVMQAATVLGSAAHVWVLR